MTDTLSAGWRATQDRQPPPPYTLLVEGTPSLPTPAHTPVLKRAEPQGVNPRVLILNLTAIAPAYPAPQVVTPAPVRYDERSGREYDQVAIRSTVATAADETIDVHVIGREPGVHGV